MSKVPTKETIKRRTIADMKSLGVHKSAYNRLIDIYADAVHQYLLAQKEFEEGGYQYETETAAGGTKKSAIVATIENLRKDILAYSDRLCLNPKSTQTGNGSPGEKKSKLANVLRKRE
ncbi:MULTISPECIES: P27 family phage terminase small subunit [Bacillus]|uniref:P27 family phage terminase small subunit n=1 Tax=Bacillus TaxID=1386 RepID=UPI0022832205|nr:MULTISPECIES: P27 family phage terminase small subunit [Bacillus]MCY8180888.1 P27 family phage terminase small subunit [Bacillus paralicheniformis]MCY8664875.1 P27 family phage terminase small subunit [Bacillus haynesii]MCY8712463.1 P27 family phage terminase small subunit [Bacillus haynesii]